MNTQIPVPPNAPSSTWIRSTLRTGRRASFAVLSLAVLLNWPGVALATDPVGFVSDSAKASFDSLRIIYGQGQKNDFMGVPQPGGDPKIRLIVQDPADYYIVTNTVDPGGYSGWHTHPGPSVVIVKMGVATAYDGDDANCTPATYPAGTGFIDPGDGHVHMVRNEGTGTLITQAFQIIPAGLSRRIDAPRPGNCPF